RSGCLFRCFDVWTNVRPTGADKLGGTAPTGSDLTGGSAVRSRVVVTAVALSAAGALALSACSSSGGNKNTGAPTGGLGGNNSSGGSATQTYKIGFIGALSGDNAQLGINERNGVQLAIEQ